VRVYICENEIERTLEQCVCDAKFIPYVTKTARYRIQITRHALNE
jgi:hypothetical protein